MVRIEPEPYVASPVVRNPVSYAVFADCCFKSLRLSNDYIRHVATITNPGYCEPALIYGVLTDDMI